MHLKEGLKFRDSYKDVMLVTEVTPELNQVVLRHAKGFTKVQNIDVFLDQLANAEYTQLSAQDDERLRAPLNIILDDKGKAKLHVKKNWCDRVNAYIGNGMSVKDAMEKSTAKLVEAGDEVPGTRQLYRWLAQGKHEKPERALAPQKSGWKAGRRRLPSIVTLAFNQVLNEQGKCGELMNLTTFRRLVNTRLSKLAANKEREPIAVGIKAVKKLLKGEIGWRSCMKKWMKPQAFRAITREAKRYHEASRFLELVEVDALRPDLHVCDEHGEILGAPTIYIFIDVATGMALGIKAFLQSPGVEPLMHACLEAFFRKPERNGRALPYGVPERILSDQGAEFRSEFWMNVLLKMNCMGVYAEGEAGWKKPHIERFNGEIQERILWRIPGSTHSEVQGENDVSLPERIGALTLNELNEVLAKFAYDTHPDIASDALSLKFKKPDMTPRKAYEQLIREHPPTLPISIKDFMDATYQYVGDAVLSHAGVTKDHLEYASNELFGLRDTIGNEKVAVFRSPLDISKIYVKHVPTNRTASAEAKYAAVQGVSAAAWAEIRTSLRLGKKPFNEHEIDVRLGEIIEGAGTRAKKKRIKDKKAAIKSTISLSDALDATAQVQETPAQEPDQSKRIIQKPISLDDGDAPRKTSVFKIPKN